MSYVGKILVIVQVVLSLLFMAFAGAVFSMHQNWKEKYATTQDAVATLEKEKTDVQQQLDLVRQEFDTKFDEEKARADRFQAENLTLQAEVKNLTAEVERKEAQREEQTGLAEAKQQEAQFRQEEAELQRIENNKLRAAVDEQTALVRDLQDQVFTRDVTLEELRKRFDNLLKKTAYLEEVVAKHKLETDPDIVEKMKMPPPPVEGVVVNIAKNRANRVELIALSIGSDDGLIISHELDVIRLNAADKSSDWLGRVRVVSLEPDSAVARVIQEAKNGIIETGDIVTSHLNQPAVSLSN